jgi:hypothetical protein
MESPNSISGDTYAGRALSAFLPLLNSPLAEKSRLINDDRKDLLAPNPLLDWLLASESPHDEEEGDDEANVRPRSVVGGECSISLRFLVGYSCRLCIWVWAGAVGRPSASPRGGSVISGAVPPSSEGTASAGELSGEFVRPI